MIKVIPLLILGALAHQDTNREMVPPYNKWTSLKGSQLQSLQAAWKDLISQKWLKKDQKNLDNYNVAFWRGKEHDYVDFSPNFDVPGSGDYQNPTKATYLIYVVSIKTRKVIRRMRID